MKTEIRFCNFIDDLVMVFHSIIQSLLLVDYPSPVFLNAGSSLDSSLVSLCKRAFRIIHGPHRHCDSCNFLNVYDRRLELSMNLLNHALSPPSHVLHDLVPHFCRVVYERTYHSTFCSNVSTCERIFL